MYKQVSRQIHEVFHEISPLVEPLSLDEAYLDVTDVKLFNGSAVRMAREIKAVIRERTSLVASAGVSYNKFLAKIASDHDKPDGFHCILPADGAAFVATLPIGTFRGVGRATETRMNELGISTGADLRGWSIEELRREFGKSADYYYQAARGIDHREVSAHRTRKSLGSETTFSENLTDTADMLAVLEPLAQQVVADLTARDMVGTTLTVKVKFSDFVSVTRAHSEPGKPLDEVRALRSLPFLLHRALIDRRRPSVRLLGISISGLMPADEDHPVQLELDV